MKSLSARRWFLSLVGATVALAPTVHAAQPVSIANAGFENPVLLEATYSTTIPSWSQGRYDTSNPGVWVAGAAISGHYNLSTNDQLHHRHPHLQFRRRPGPARPGA